MKNDERKKEKKKKKDEVKILESYYISNPFHITYLSINLKRLSKTNP